MKRRLLLSVVLLSLGFLSLVGCDQPRPPVIVNPCNDELYALRYAGVQVIEMGDQARIIVPMDLIFPPNSTAIIPRSFSTLRHVANVMLCYRKVNVNIGAYSDNRCPPKVSLALTETQAQIVAAHLWKTGINARFLTVHGYGEYYPIASNGTPAGRAQNRRLELTFTQVTKPFL